MAAFKPQIDAFRTREAMRFLLNMLRNFELRSPGDKPSRKRARKSRRMTIQPVDDKPFSIFDADGTGVASDEIPGVVISDPDVFALPASLVTNDSLHTWYVSKIPAKTRKAAEERYGRNKVSFEDGTTELLRCLWCDGAIRPKLLEYLASIPLPEQKDADVVETNFRGYC